MVGVPVFRPSLRVMSVFATRVFETGSPARNLRALLLGKASRVEEKFLKVASFQSVRQPYVTRKLRYNRPASTMVFSTITCSRRHISMLLFVPLCLSTSLI
jgi:hypothetical protein